MKEKQQGLATNESTTIKELVEEGAAAIDGDVGLKRTDDNNLSNNQFQALAELEDMGNNINMHLEMPAHDVGANLVGTAMDEVTAQKADPNSQEIENSAVK